ncbi:DUF1640 domain-containing protein [Rickettsiales endosymbiont of Trichoplax sp. H2]|uniref:DUF1640 domain-containing protein n=1 Tax=Rickettsiales endosymbiont of Trichoplax sp. H2 TaxID=2021221 RepID=UPI0012B1C45D|nr:DUF1640 domain-containing protein [Rickettsiales endosymbiont of Trichoplax sp. H2]MSO13562.1 hypothetical protein [Rickettsiales endosymbiont of Trichoplax sp. H2]
MYYKTFDTHKYIKSLQETGFNEQQAEMLVKSLLESRDFDLSILATREQVAEVKSDLQKKISEAKSDLQKDINKIEDKFDKKFSTLEEKIDKNKYDLVKWLVTLFITMIIAIYLKR